MITITVLGFAMSVIVFIIVILLICCLYKFVVGQRKLVRYDTLTGLMSYTLFIQKARAKLSKAKPMEYTLALIDIDDFKFINEIVGIKKADAVLQIGARFIQEVINVEEIEKYLLTRKTADRFLVLYKAPVDVLNKADAVKYGVEFSERVNKQLEINTDLRCSIGKVCIDDPQKDVLLLIGEAQRANEQCKNEYNTYMRTYDANCVNQVEKNILYAMNKRLFEGALQIYFQPKYDLISEEIVGAEALVRWIEEGQVVYDPEQFIPVFERYHFIVELDMFMLEQLCITIQELNRKSQEPMLLSVNISRVTLVEENIVERMLEVIGRYNVRPDQIEIEITENALCNECEEISDEVKRLKEAGFYISLDDFGRGQASVASIYCFTVDIIKLDKVFLSDTLAGENRKIMLKNLICLIHDLGLKVVAEGIETKEDVEMLRETKCDLAQGFYFSRPVSKETFYELLTGGVLNEE